MQSSAEQAPDRADRRSGGVSSDPSVRLDRVTRRAARMAQVQPEPKEA